MKERSKRISARLGAAVALMACVYQPSAATAQSLPFTDKYWKLEALTVSPAIDWDLDGKPDSNILPLLDECERDDRMLLRKDGRMMGDQGEDACDEEEERVYERGKWHYSAAEKTLSLDEYGKKQVCQVVESSANKLVLQYPFKATNGKSHTMRAVYVFKP